MKTQKHYAPQVTKPKTSAPSQDRWIDGSWPVLRADLGGWRRVLEDGP